MQLDDHLKTKVRFHLGFNAGAQIPAGDRSRLEEAMALVPDEYWYDQIVYHIKRCDNAWQVSAYFPDDILDPQGKASSTSPARKSSAVTCSGRFQPQIRLKEMSTSVRSIFEKSIVWLKHCMSLITAGLRFAVMHLNDLAQSSLWQFQDLLIQLSVAAFSLGCITGKCRIKKELPRHKDAFRTGNTEDCCRPKARWR